MRSFQHGPEWTMLAEELVWIMDIQVAPTTLLVHDAVSSQIEPKNRPLNDRSLQRSTAVSTRW